MMPVIPLAISLIASLVPDMLRLFKNDKAGDVAEKVIGIARSVTGLDDPAASVASITESAELAARFKLSVMSQQLELERLAFDRERLYVTDTQHARQFRDAGIFGLGVSVLLTFAAVVCMILLGSFEIMSGQYKIDSAMFASLTGFVGTLVGYVAANAQQVIGFYFGSSQGSRANSAALADSVKSMANK